MILKGNFRGWSQGHLAILSLMATSLTVASLNMFLHILRVPPRQCFCFIIIFTSPFCPFRQFYCVRGKKESFCMFVHFAFTVHYILVPPSVTHRGGNGTQPLTEGSILLLHPSSVDWRPVSTLAQLQVFSIRWWDILLHEQIDQVPSGFHSRSMWCTRRWKGTRV